MTKIKNAFENGKAFIPFITCGDPDLGTTEKIIDEMIAAGADLIELGIPFSDPTAEGPVIQEGNLRALSGGVTTDKIFGMVAKVREKHPDTPMVFMTYANVIYSYGADKFAGSAPGRCEGPAADTGSGAEKAGEGVSGNNLTDTPGAQYTKKAGTDEFIRAGAVSRYGPEYADDGSSLGARIFIRRAAELGIDGLILPDVPFEEKDEFDGICREYGLDLISMIAPTSHERIKRIASQANGFIYCVSSLGVTGVRSEITTDIGAMVRLVKEARPDIPCAVGFGISTPEQAAKMASLSDGAIVGSAIVKIVAKYGKDAPSYVGEYVRSMKDAVRRKLN